LRIILSPFLPAASSFEGWQPIEAEAQPSPFPTMLFIIKTLLVKLLIAASAAGVIYALC
jgi:hypothetical protein